MIQATVKNGKLTIIADLDGTSTSKSGKSIVVATTSGFVKLDGISYSLNVIKGK
jgi:hypothetical protein